MKLARVQQWLQARWLLGARRFDALGLRERLLIVIGSALGLLLLWNSAAMQPLYERARRANAQLAATAPDAAQVSELDHLLDLEAQLTAQQTQKKLRLEQRAASLVDPDKMHLLLTEIISSSRGLRLVKLANLPVEELHGPPSTEGTAADTADTSTSAADLTPAVAFVHGIDITVAGDYAAVSRYIRQLETQPWHFLWRRLELDSSHYPEVSARIEIATLGLERQWLTL